MTDYCRDENCMDVPFSRGWCRKHYTRSYRSGFPGEPRCSDTECEELAVYGEAYCAKHRKLLGCRRCGKPIRSRGLCITHYQALNLRESWKRKASRVAKEIDDE